MASHTNALLEPVPSYPVFEANQLLSSDDLNNVVDYLDQQTRLTRLCTIGAGIACGLVPRWKSNGLQVSAGCGVTSEGFLLHVEQSTYHHFAARRVKRALFLETGADTDAEVAVRELYAAKQQDSEELSETVVKSKVVALVLERADHRNEACLDDCDEKGTQREFRARAFLLDPDVALDILKENYASENPNRLFSDKYELPDVYLERFGYTAATVEESDAQAALADIRNYPTFLTRYQTVLDLGAQRVHDALKTAHRMFTPVFSGNAPHAALPELPLARFQPQNKLDQQYLYGHLQDLIRAYEEFRTVAFDLMDVCRTDAGWFPRHLFLGRPLGAGEELPIPPTAERTAYLQPALYNDNRLRVDESETLFQRLTALIENFAVPRGEVPLRITPSRWGDASLSKRAIPFYYKGQETLHRFWNADRRRKAKQLQIHGYHMRDIDQQAPPYDEPLVFDLESHDFLRIEGHLGQELGKVERDIQEQRKDFNLPFDLLALKIGERGDPKSAFQFECKAEGLESQYVKARTDLTCVLRAHNDGGIYQELLEKLKPTMAEFDYAAFEEKFDAAPNVVKDCLLGHSKLAFKALADARDGHTQAVLDKTLFHNFAEEHPGLVHLAGVPRGGTFVLVFVERNPTPSERRHFVSRIDGLVDLDILRTIEKNLETIRVVVADFCLPYACCSNCPPLATVIARPRPTFLLEKHAYCANDDQRYSFMVAPPGGILSGPGTRQEDYTFVPSQTGENDGIVVAKYELDGVEATFAITILPVPDVSFLLPARICPTADPVPLNGQPPRGTFTTDIDPNNPALGIVDGSFDPGDPDVPREQPIAVTYSVEVENGCSGSATHTTIVKDPDPDFGGLRKNYCSHERRTELTPVETEPGTSTFSGPGMTGAFFDPSSVDFQGDVTTVTVRHVFVDADECRAETSKKAVVFRRPERVSFRVTPLPPDAEAFRFRIEDISPAQATHGLLRYRFDWGGPRSQTVEQPAAFDLRIPKPDLTGLNVVGLTLDVLIQHPDDPGFVCAGQPFKRESDIIRDGNSPVVNRLQDAVDLSGDAADRLRERVRSNVAEFDALAEAHEGLKETRSFKDAKAVAESVLELDSERLVKEYADIVRIIVPVVNRPTEDPARKKAFQSLASLATRALLDGLASKATADEHLQSAVESLTKMAEVLELDKVSEAWRSAELEGHISGTRIEAVEKLLK